MRCQFCGSKAIYPQKNHEQASAGRVVAGAIIAGAVGAAVGLAGKNVNGYRCSACGMFSKQTMDFAEESLVNAAVQRARSGDLFSYERYQEKYANLEYIPAQQAQSQSVVVANNETYKVYEEYEDCEDLEEIKNSYSPNQFVVGAPVYVSNVTIVDDNGNDALWLEVTNISDKKLRSAYFQLTVYDDVGDQVNTNTLVYQKLSVAPGELIPQAKPFNLKTNVAYRVDAVCEKAAFTDNSVWRMEKNQTVYALPEKTELAPESFEQYKYLRALLEKKSKISADWPLYYPEIEETHRLCICGNPVAAGCKCLVCGLDEADLAEVLDYDVLVQSRKAVIIKAAQERTKAVEKLYSQAQEDRYQESLLLLQNPTPENCVVAANLLSTIEKYKDAAEWKKKARQAAQQASYDTGIGLMSGENYEAAIAEFEKAGSWQDAENQIKICREKIEQRNAQAEADRLERERQAEIARQEAEERAESKRRAKIVISVIAVLLIIAAILLVTVAIPEKNYLNALSLKNSGQYEQAIVAFQELKDYRDSREQIEECNYAILVGKYNNAVTLMNEGRYLEAIAAFQAISGFMDSAAKIKDCNYGIADNKYNEAIALMNGGQYEDASAAFRDLGDHRDSAELAKECKYILATALMGAGKQEEAYAVFREIWDYKDSTQKAETLFAQIKAEKLKNAEIGSYVYFGTYEQDNNLVNGAENIEWLVLEITGKKALVISKYALEAMAFDSQRPYTIWEWCTANGWLNRTFYESAFTANEKKMILTTAVQPHNNPEYGTNAGSAVTQNEVFLLSASEVNKYFRTDSLKRCKVTAYAQKQCRHVDDEGFCEWWLRTPGKYRELAVIVESSGEVFTWGRIVDEYSLGIRPAIWINLS